MINLNKIFDKTLRKWVEKEPYYKNDGYEYYRSDGSREFQDKWNDFLTYEKYPFMIRLFYGLYLFILIENCIRFILALQNLKREFIPGNLFLTMIWMLLPCAIWVWSTAYEYWNFHFRKKWSLYLVIIGILIQIAEQIGRFIFYPVITFLSHIPINNEITPLMVIWLIRFVIFFISVMPMFVIWLVILNFMTDQTNLKVILSYKVTKGVDLRKHKNFAYDFTAVKRMDNGKPQVVREHDRSLHTVVDGTTGTAKTSSVLIPAIAKDLDQKRENENYQKKECVRHLQKGDFRICRPFDDQDFSINYIEPVITGKPYHDDSVIKDYEFLKYVSSSAGITVVAPNEGLADSVYELCVNRGIKVNRIDPILLDGDQKKPGFVGINPLFINPQITGVVRDVAITNNASIFADVLKALYELSGASDAYFVSVNNSITVAISKLLMLTFEDINGRQPHPGDVQMCINVFELTKPYLNRLVEKYGNNGKPMQECYDGREVDRVVSDLQSTQEINCGIWNDVYTLIKYDLLSPDMGPKMYDRANGLRLQINSFMNHPLIREVLCSPATLNIDKALENGEVTIVNYSLELGQSVSLAFGLFFLLTFSKAVLRRPGEEKTRILHFDYIDEFPVLLHPYLEEYFSLHRQYRVCNMVALQTFDQMEKDKKTSFLKSVLLGVGHQIVFGRVSTTEMEIYETMGGKIMKDEIQKTISETSITEEKPNYSYSTRRTMKESAYITGTDLRYRDFQEVTFFTTEENTPLRPIHGKVNFLKPSNKKGYPPLKVRWTQYYDEAIIEMESIEQRNSLPGASLPRMEDLIELEYSVQQRKNNINIRFGAEGFVTCDGQPAAIPDIETQPVLQEYDPYNPDEEETGENTVRLRSGCIDLESHIRTEKPYPYEQLTLEQLFEGEKQDD